MFGGHEDGSKEEGEGKSEEGPSGNAFREVEIGEDNENKREEDVSGEGGETHGEKGRGGEREGGEVVKGQEKRRKKLE